MYIDNGQQKCISTMDNKNVSLTISVTCLHGICGFSKRCHKANDLTESANELHLTGATTLCEGYITIHISGRY